MTGYHAVATPRRWRWRRRLRRIRLVALVWLAGTAGVAGWWWATHPEVGLLDTVLAVVAYAVLLGAALGQPPVAGRR